MKPAVVPAESSPWQIKDVPIVDVANCAGVAAGCSVRISKGTGKRVANPLAVGAFWQLWRV